MQRSDLVYYRLYHEEGPGIFEWWNILIKICTINNYEDMYNPLEVLGKGSFATVYKREGRENILSFRFIKSKD